MLFACTRVYSSSFVLNTLSLALVSILIPDALFAYPVFGTKSYGRSTGLPHRVSTWGFPAPPPLQAYQHSQTHYGLGISSAPNYYAADSVVNYPYTQDYPDNDYYYAQEPGTFGTYPYYPAGSSVTNGNMKYSVYQPTIINLATMVPHFFRLYLTNLGRGISCPTIVRLQITLPRHMEK